MVYFLTIICYNINVAANQIKNRGISFMLKHELREQGFSVTDHYQKKPVIAAVWVIVALSMAAAAFFPAAWILGAEDNYVLDFFDQIVGAINSRFDAASVIYLVLWLGIGTALYFYTKKQSNITLIIFSILILCMVFVFLLLIFENYDTVIEGMDGMPIKPPAFFGFFEIFGQDPFTMFIFLIMFFVYFAMKLVMTILFSSEKVRSIQFKFIKFNAMPVCHCKEALKIWQTTAIYLLPAVFMYLLFFILSVRGANTFYAMTFLFFMIFFMSFDSTAVIYTLIFKFKYKPDFIALDSHIYDVALFKRSFIRSGAKTARKNIAPAVRDSHIKKAVFTEIKTCLNIECDNYSKELDGNAKVCPLCGKRIYKTSALADMKTCLNMDCENYGYELKQEMETCSLCGGKMEKFALDYNPVWANTAIIVSLVSAVVFCFIYWQSAGETWGAFVDGIRNIVLAGSVVMGFMSKRKSAVFVSVTAALFTIGFIIIMFYM